MKPTRLEEILHHIEDGGSAGEVDLKSDEFEAVCRELAEQWASAQFIEPFRIEYRKQEPIDILIEENHKPAIQIPGSQMISGETKKTNRHFIECKLYGRDLELSVVSAPYLYALRERPQSLVIATNRKLTSGAEEYASWLFKQELHGQTTLSTWNPLDTADQSERPQTDSSGETTYSVHRPSIEIISWKLALQKPFQDEFIAISRNENRSLYWMSPDARFRFRAVLHNPVTHRRLKRIVLRFKDEQDGEIAFALKNIGTVAGNVEVEGIIPARQFRANVTYAPPSMDLHTSSGQDTYVNLANFPRLSLADTVLVLPDFREEDTDKLYRDWMSARDARILLLEGEGGIGKTFMCERLAARANENGYRAAHTPLEVRTEPGFISELVWMLLSPEMKAVLKASDREITGALMQELGHSYGMDATDCDASALADLLITGEWSGDEPEILMQMIARLMVGSGKPLLLIVSNAHRASDSVAYALRTLLAALESTGEWGQVRIIVEARDTPEDLGEAWAHLFSWMRKSIGHRLKRHSLEQFSKHDVEDRLASIITSTDSATVARLICDKAGGNALFVVNLLQALLEQNVLQTQITRYAADARSVSYVIGSISALRMFISDLGPKVEDILVSRINFWHHRLLQSEGGTDGVILGLMGLLDIDVSEHVLAVLTGEPDANIETALIELNRASLVELRASGHYGFKHEFIGMAAKTWLNTLSSHTERIMAIADRRVDIKGTHAFELALSKGLLQAYLNRSARALEALNAALQFAQDNFNDIFRCYQEIHAILYPGAASDNASAFHANVHQYLSHGYYILPAEKGVEINRQALSALEGACPAVLNYTDYDYLYRRYNHNLSNIAIRQLDLGSFFRHAEVVLDLCSTPLELAQFLNRAIKVCTLCGATGIGRTMGEMAYALQLRIAPSMDPDLMSVLFGEVSFLYALVSPEDALFIAEQACQHTGTERQRVHDLVARAAAFLRMGDVSPATQDLQKIEDLTTKLGLKSMYANVSLLRGTSALAEGRWHLAADSFRVGLSDVAWQGNRRDELLIGNNMVVALVLADHLERAANLLNALLAIAAQVSPRHDPLVHLEKLLRKTQNRVVKHPEWLKDQDQQEPWFPEITGIGPNILSPLLLNAQTLFTYDPAIFPSISDYGFSNEDVPPVTKNTPARYLSCEMARGGGRLYAVC